MAQPLENSLRQRIDAGERIGVDALMHMALLDPEHGYYSRQQVFGKDGDFTTAPEICQIFGEVIAAYFAANIGPMKAASPGDLPSLVELGPGRGTLMGDMLRSFQYMPENMRPLDVTMVEASAALTKKQQQHLIKFALPIDWQETVDALPKRPCMVVANEFFDALPIRQFVHANADWHERVLGVEHDNLAWTLSDTDIPKPAQKMLAGLDPQTAKEPVTFEYPEAGIAVMQQLASHMARYGGMLLLVDYGYSQHALGDTLQAVRGHRYVDVLSDLGQADITSHVNIACMREVAEAQGLKTHICSSQGQFLRSLGAEMRAVELCKSLDGEARTLMASGIERLISPAQMGDLFKVLVVAHPSMTALELGI